MCTGKSQLFARSFEFIDIRDLRLNPFDAIDGLAPFEQDQVVVKSLAANYGFQLAEHEIHLALEEVRAKTLVSFVTLRDHLAAKVYRGVTNRPRFVTPRF